VLVASTGAGCPVDLARRRASLTLDGTPVVYSAEVGRAVGNRRLRLLVEPGNLDLDVAGHLACALATLRRLHELLGWPAPDEAIGGIWERIVPPDPDSVSAWWGGAWLGAALGGALPPELRLYLNLRHGDAAARWQRVADVLCGYADEELIEPFQRLLARVGPRAIPVGLGCVIRRGSLAGIRLYAGVHAPAPEAVAACCSLALSHAAARAAEAFCDSFATAFGSPRPQAVTISHDFALDTAGELRPEPTRFKVDVSCQPIRDRAALIAWVDAVRARSALGAAPLGTFVDALERAFGGWDVEYLSASFTSDVDKLTVYARPHGQARSGARANAS
jgi:hypothetical protein